MSAIHAIPSEKALEHDVASLEKSITSTEIPAAKEEAIVIEYAVEEEQDEPLLKRTRTASYCSQSGIMRYGTCTRRPKRPSGPPKRLI
ncbi:hypothetical protein RUND412_010047 [Rhizina undulata]